VKVLAQDHRNDVICNTFGATTALLGHYVWKYMDPIGGLCVSLILMFSWGTTTYENVMKMTGKCAESEFLSKVLYIVVHHDKRIAGVENIIAYYTSNSYTVEVDIILPSKLELQKSHNIAESLQIKLEKLPEVERAYVHSDFELHSLDDIEHPSQYWKAQQQQKKT